MMAHTTACIGVVTIYFGEDREPTAIEKRMLETYGKIAADRIAALLGPEPVSIRAQALFDKVLGESERAERKALALQSREQSYHQNYISH